MPGNAKNWGVAFFAMITTVAFFISWVSWAGTGVPGYYLPAGDFFSIAENKHGLANPYPQFDFLLAIFWLVPLLSLTTFVIALLGKKTGMVAGLAGLLALSMATVFILFTNTLLQLGVGKSLLNSSRFGIYLTIAGGMGLILAGMRTKILAKIGLILLGPIAVFISFKVIEKKLATETYDDSAKLKPDYVVNALDLISEFRTNDSLANAKYREKIIEVRGRISETETLSDSTTNIKISDPSSSYIGFTLEKNFLEEVRKYKVNDSIIIKGSCSGGIYSDILETEAITFKRCVLVNQ